MNNFKHCKTEIDAKAACLDSAVLEHRRPQTYCCYTAKPQAAASHRLHPRHARRQNRVEPIRIVKSKKYKKEFDNLK